MSEPSAVELSEPAQIAQLAFRIYEEEGRPEGKADEHWARAERAIHEQRLPGPATVQPSDDGRAGEKRPD